MDELFNTITQLSTTELDQFIPRVLTERAKRLAPSVSRNEAQLLQKINYGLSSEVQDRYNELTRKQRARKLSTSEETEFFELIEQIEQADARRVRYLAELAQVRGVSLDTVMSQLGIRPRPYA